MNREDIKELHYITPIANLGSIRQRGILSHSQAKNIQHSSVAMEDVQEKRTNKTLNICGRESKLHDYVNLYFDARNPMMYKRRHHDLCVLRVNPNVLDTEGTIVTDRNAASKEFVYNVASSLNIVKKDLVFARSWNHPDAEKKKECGAIKCAEVLVPECIAPTFILGIYIPEHELEGRIKEIYPHISVTVNGDLFFR